MRAELLGAGEGVERGGVSYTSPSGWPSQASQPSPEVRRATAMLDGRRIRRPPGPCGPARERLSVGYDGIATARITRLGASARRASSSRPFRSAAGSRRPIPSRLFCAISNGATSSSSRRWTARTADSGLAGRRYPPWRSGRLSGLLTGAECFAPALGKPGRKTKRRRAREASPE